MSEYVIQKKTACPNCYKGFINLTREMKAAIDRGDVVIPVPPLGKRGVRAVSVTDFSCKLCDGRGVIYEEVDLLDVLKKIEWQSPLLGHDVIINE